MVGRNEVWNAAARIRARPPGQDGWKERVSVRSVRKELGKGSFSDIARPLFNWKRVEKYQPIIEEAALPDAFATRLATLGREMLEQARIEVTRERLAEYAAR
ncbi:DNA-binding protein [Methylobacterium sp. J-068]|uniref:DNA-binding protein n=1 Tax=Methylobacterium sp. J-068 TaxID=2836649 RepID=UPI001FB977B2|nr:DNA-binding protein [Methylobacterium sp. J-068]MCJ2035583.1 DNA-binding protein [Methylobacterium sp. J-068]